MPLAQLLAHASRLQRIALGVMALTIVTVAGYAVLAPRVAQRAALSERRQARAMEALQARAEEAKLRPLRAQAVALRHRVDATRHRMPPDPAVPVLYRQLSEVAAQSGLALALFAPKAIESKPAVAELAVFVTLEGDYHRVAGFLARMGHLTRIFSVRDLRLVAVERPTGTVRADLTVVAHFLRPDRAPTAASMSMRAASAPVVAPSPGRPANVR